jgi:hypothetical protein
VIVGEVVTQIRTDDNQGFRASPKGFKDLRHLFRECLAHDEGNQGEVSKSYLKKGQVDFQAVLSGMSLVQSLDLREVQDSPQCLAIHRNRAKGGFKGLGGAGS